ncbi:MAG: hypothetical protein U0X93_02805 [Anaerolineales bacterium]
MTIQIRGCGRARGTQPPQGTTPDLRGILDDAPLMRKVAESAYKAGGLRRADLHGRTNLPHPF